MELIFLLNSCPLGFRLDNSLGACVCSDLFTHIKDFEEKPIICNTDSNMFSKPAGLNLWIGTDLTGKEFLVAYCNPRYCNVGSQFDLLHLNKTRFVYFLLNIIRNIIIMLWLQNGRPLWRMYHKSQCSVWLY